MWCSFTRIVMKVETKTKTKTQDFRIRKTRIFLEYSAKLFCLSLILCPNESRILAINWYKNMLASIAILREKKALKLWSVIAFGECVWTIFAKFLIPMFVVLKKTRNFCKQSVKSCVGTWLRHKRLFLECNENKFVTETGRI